VEEVLIDGSPAPVGALRVPSGTQRLELRYTALGLRVANAAITATAMILFDHRLAR